MRTGVGRPVPEYRLQEMKVKLRNFTPHTINVMRDSFDGRDITVMELPSEGVARIDVTSETVMHVELFDGSSLPVKQVIHGDVTGLPAPEPGVRLVVSVLVAQGAKDRFDLVSPGDLVRDPEGRVIGCKSLALPSHW